MGFAPSETTEPAIALSATTLLRRYAIAQDHPRFESTLSLIRTLRDPAPALLGASNQWDAYVRGDWSALRQSLSAPEHVAQSVEFAELRIDAVALRALSQEAEGNVSAALQSARTASRMARAEGVLDSEFLATYVLARMRRWTGRPLVAASVINTLAEYAPSIWQGLCQWEALLSEGAHTPERLGRGPSMHAANSLRRFLQAAARGNPTQVAEAWLALAAVAKHWPPAASDVAQLGSALGCVSGGSPEFQRWRAGEHGGPSPGLPSVPSTTGGLASAVVVFEGGDGRRVPNLFKPNLPSGMHEVEGAATHPRLHTLLAVLGLAGGQGLAEAQAFHRVYGFDYEADIHSGRWGVLIHRARERLGNAATLRREDGRLQLTAATNGLIIADPRTAPSAGEQVLRFLLHRPAASARDIASALDAPLRSVQATLKELVEQDLCSAEQEGRSWSYRIEDTTFQAPTAFREASAKTTPDTRKPSK